MFVKTNWEEIMNPVAQILRSLTILSTLAMTIFCIPAFTADPLILELPEYAKNLQLPPRLYHWTSDEYLRERSRFRGFSRIVIGGLQWPPKEPVEAMFTTENPVFGMGIGGELYAWSENELLRTISAGQELWRKFFPLKRDPNKKPARLLTIAMKPNARIGLAVTAIDEERRWHLDVDRKKTFAGVNPNIVVTPNPGAVDLIYHLCYIEEQVFFQEWIITNENAIAWSSANPEAARPEIEKTLRLIKEKPYSEIDRKLLHHRQFVSYPRAYKEILEDFFEKGVKGIKNFDHGTEPPAIQKTCSELFVGV